MLYEVIEHENNCRILCYAVRSHKRMMHYHREIEILYVLQGEIYVVYNGRPRALHCHDMVVLESDALHDVYSTDPENSLLVLQIHPDFFSEFDLQLSEMSFQRHFFAPSADELYQRLRVCLSEIVARYQMHTASRPFYLIRITCEILLLLMENLKLATPRENGSKAEDLNLRLSRIIRHIDANCGGPISLKEIANREGVSFYYLSHFFHERLGMTFQEFITRRRLHNAEHMLANTDKNLTTVSRECGFSDPRYLKRAFLSEYGVELSEYLKNRKFHSPIFIDSMANGSNYPVDLSIEEILGILRCDWQSARKGGPRHESGIHSLQG